jgi:hypothetical protein
MLMHLGINVDLDSSLSHSLMLSEGRNAD